MKDMHLSDVPRFLFDRSGFLNVALKECNYDQLKNYPDRHRLHYEALIKLYGAPFPSIHFLLLNTIEEAFEPIARVLAPHPMHPNWHEDGLLPLLESRDESYRKAGTVVLIAKTTKSLKRLKRLAVYYSPVIKTPLIKTVRATDVNSADEAVTRDTRVIVVCNTSCEWPIETIRDLAIRYKNTWLIVYNSQSNRFNSKWNESIACLANLVLIQEFPKYLKLEGDSSAAAVIARPELICQMQAHSFMVWYNMDFLHTQFLLSYLHNVESKGKPVRAKLTQLHRAEANRVQNKIRMDFNETRTQPSDAPFRQVIKILPTASYDDSISAAIKAISNEQKVPPENLLLCRGANHGIKRAILGLLNPGDKVVLPDVTYIGHVKGILGAGGDPIYVSVVRGQEADPLSLRWNIEGLLEATKSYQPKLLCISNPSNPLGEVLDNNAFDYFIREIRRLSPKTTVLVDLCFHQFGEALKVDMPRYSNYLDDYRVVLIGSLSKEDGYAGARAGFLYGSQKEIGFIKKTYPQNSIISLLGAVTLAIARSPGMRTHRLATINRLIAENRRIQDGIRQLNKETGVKIFVKDIVPTSFTLLTIDRVSESEAISWFKISSNIDIAGVYRFADTPASIFRYPKFQVIGKAESNLLRISPGTPQQNDFFMHELARFLYTVK